MSLFTGIRTIYSIRRIDEISSLKKQERQTINRYLINLWYAIQFLFERERLCIDKHPLLELLPPIEETAAVKRAIHAAPRPRSCGCPFNACPFRLGQDDRSATTLMSMHSRVIQHVEILEDLRQASTVGPLPEIGRQIWASEVLYLHDELVEWGLRSHRIRSRRLNEVYDDVWNKLHPRQTGSLTGQAVDFVGAINELWNG